MWHQARNSDNHWHNGDDGVVGLNVHGQYVGEYFTARGAVEVGRFVSLSDAQEAVDGAQSMRAHA